MCEEQYLSNLLDIKLLAKLQSSFSDILEVPLRLLDETGNCVLKPIEAAECCRIIRGTEQGLKRCEESTLALFERVKQTKQPLTGFNCYVGFELFAVPVKQDSKVLGVFVGCPLLVHGPKQMHRKLRDISGELGIEKTFELLRAADKLKGRSPESIGLLVDFTVAQTELVVRSAYVELEEEEIVSELINLYEELVMLYDIGEALSATLDIKEISRQVLGKAVEIFDVERGSIMFVDEERKELIMGDSCGLDKKVEKAFRQRIGEGVAGKVAQEGKAFLDNQFVREKDFRKTCYTTKTLLCVPMKIGKKVVGVINMSDKRSGDMFTAGDKRLLTTLAGQAAIAIQHSRLYDRMRRLNEEELRIKDSAMASSINAIAISDLERNLTYINNSFLKLWGYDEDKEVLGKPAVKFWQMEEKASGIEKALRDRGSWIGELVAKRKDDSTFDVQLSASMVTDEVGKPICMMASFVDITERKRAEEKRAKLLKEVERANRELQDFIYIASHDLRAPLVNIQGFSKRLEGVCTKAVQALKEISLGIKGGSSMENWEGDLERLIGEMERKIPPSFDFVFKGVKNMDEMTEQLLQLSRLTTRLAPRTVVDLAGMVQEIVGTMRFQIEEKGIEVTVGPLPRVACEEPRIHQVFSNLLSNAINYIGEDNPAPKIEIGCRDLSACNAQAGVQAGDEDPHLFFVRDNGIGIDKEDHEKLFRIFTRVGEHRVSGHGMGLAFVKKIVERYGGQIWVESEKGKGSTFYFTISKHLAQEA